MEDSYGVFQLDKARLAEVLQLLHSCFNQGLVPTESLQENLNKIFELAKRVDFHYYVFHVFVSGKNYNLDVSSRRAAGLIFKNNIRLHFTAYPHNIIKDMKAQLLLFYDAPEKPISKIVANIVAYFADATGFMWPELFRKLFDSFNLNNPVLCDLIFETLKNISEDLAAETVNFAANDNRYVFVHELLEFLIKVLLNVKNPDYLAIALCCVHEFLLDFPDEVIKSHGSIINILLNYMKCDHPRVLEQLIVCLGTLVEITDYMDNYVNIIFEFLIFQMVNVKDYKVALEATDFFYTLLDDGHMIDQISNYTSQLVPVLIKNIKYSQYDFDEGEIDAEGNPYEDEEELEDNEKPVFLKVKETNNQNLLKESDSEDDNSRMGDSWTLRKASAATLDVYARILKSKIGPLVFQVIEPLFIQKSSWEIIELVILVFGAISKGSYEEVVPLLEKIMPFLIQNICAPQMIIRCNALWTVSRYTRWFNNPDSKMYFEAFLKNVFCTIRDKYQKVQGSALVSLSVTIESCPIIVAQYLPVILKTLNESCPFLKKKSLIPYFDTVATILDVIPDADKNEFLLVTVCGSLLSFWSQNMSKFTRNLLPLMECVISMINSFGPNFAAYHETVLNNCTYVINFSHKCIESGEIILEEDMDFMVVATDIITSLIDRCALRPEFIINYNLKGLIPILLSVKADCLKIPSYCFIGELVKNHFEIIADVAPNLIILFLKNLDLEKDLLSKSSKLNMIVNNSLWCLSLLCEKTPPQNLVNYCDSILRGCHKFLSLSEHFDKIKSNTVILTCTLLSLFPEKSKGFPVESFKQICCILCHMKTTREKFRCCKIMVGISGMNVDKLPGYVIFLIKVFVQWESSSIITETIVMLQELLSMIMNSSGKENVIKFLTTSLEPSEMAILTGKYGIN